MLNTMQYTHNWTLSEINNCIFMGYWYANVNGDTVEISASHHDNFGAWIRRDSGGFLLRLDPFDTYCNGRYTGKKQLMADLEAQTRARLELLEVRT